MAGIIGEMEFNVITETVCDCGVETVRGFASGDSDDITARFATSKEDGARDSGPLNWMNSARMILDPEEDSVTMVVSIGDPRGGLAFTIRRTRDDRLLIHVPHEGAGMQHCDVRQLQEGTFEIGGRVGSESEFHALTFERTGVEDEE